MHKRMMVVSTEVPCKWSMNSCFNPISQWSLSIFIHIIQFQCLKQGQQPRLDQGTSDLAHQKDVAWWVLPGRQNQLPWQPPLVCCCHRWRWKCWFLWNPKCCYHTSPTCCHNWGKRSSLDTTRHRYLWEVVVLQKVKQHIEDMRNIMLC